MMDEREGRVLCLVLGARESLKQAVRATLGQD
jgi:hypothetical protein